MSTVPTNAPFRVKRVARSYSLIESLKDKRPAVCVVYDEDGKVITKINVPDIHNRHVHVLEALNGVPWETVDLFDKKDGLLLRHKRNADDRAPAGDIEDIPVSKDVAQLAGVVKVISTALLNAQQLALDRHREAQSDVIGAHVKLLESATKRLEVAEQRLTREQHLNYRLSSEMLASQLQLPAGPTIEGEDGEESTMTGSVLGQLLPNMIGQWFQNEQRKAQAASAAERKPPKSAPKSNGVNGHATKSEDRSSAGDASKQQGTS